MLGTTLGHYTIIRELGHGGMGIVYLARDARLERDVALKVLPKPAESDSELARRFLREARVASAVQHPNIVSIYDVGESEQGQFVAMEFVEGETLRARLKSRPIAVAECVAITRQIAAALEAAQTRNIVHRDIKPENVMLTPGGHVKVLDFGLARRQTEVKAGETTELATVSQITAAFQVMGTLAYMSPEQLAGRTVDGRSDIYSLGVTLYEMLAGRRPFEAPSSTEVIGRIFNVEPERLALFNPEVPDALEEIVRKCLAKDPAQRYQTAGELAADLAILDRDSRSGQLTARTASSPVAPLAPRKLSRRVLWPAVAIAAVLLAGAGWYWLARPKAIDSIAVLPFLNSAGDKELDYLADGLGDSIINDLSGISGLQVTSRAVSQRYSGRNLDLQSAGRQLNVKALLSGQVAQHGDNLTVRTELMDVATGARIWGRVYERPMKSLAELQEALSSDVARELRIALGSREGAKTVRRYSANSEAYQLYLKGRFRMVQRDKDDLNTAVQLFQQAVDKDKQFALAYAGLADAYTLIATRGYQNATTVLDQATEAARRAVELDSNLSEAWVSLAVSRTRAAFDWQGAERDYRRAIELNPKNAEAHTWYAMGLLAPLGRPEEALLQIQRAIELDPGALGPNMSQGVILYFARRYDKAIARFQAVDKIAPGFVFAKLHLALAYTETDQKTEALRILQNPELAAKTPAEAKCILGTAFAAAGRDADARRIADEVEKEAERSFLPPYGLAELEIAVGRKAKALDYLEKAYEIRDQDFLYLNVDPKLDALRSEKRFQALLKKGKFL